MVQYRKEKIERKSKTERTDRFYPNVERILATRYIFESIVSDSLDKFVRTEYTRISISASGCYSVKIKKKKKERESEREKAMENWPSDESSNIEHLTLSMLLSVCSYIFYIINGIPSR